MSVRRLVIEVDTDGLNVARFCREHGISTWFFWDLRRRHRRFGDVVLEPAPRVAGHVANKTPAAIEEVLVAKRKELVDAGLDAGAETIAWHLRDVPGVPSPSTIWRILRARGFIEAQPAKAPKRTIRSFTAERANECWQLDDTCWELANATPVKILNVIDDHSRLLVASTATTSCTGMFAFNVLAEAATVLGWPARFLSDNAGAFRHVLADALGSVGIVAGHSRPYHPQTNGKVERFHETLKRWLPKQPSPTTVAELQAQLDMFRHLYNHQRPHKSLAKRVPADVWTAAPKTGSAKHPVGTTTRLHTGTTSAEGVFTARPYVISLGRAHAHRQVTTIITGLACHVFSNDRLIRAFTIDPTRRVQPLRLP